MDNFKTIYFFCALFLILGFQESAASNHEATADGQDSNFHTNKSIDETDLLYDEIEEKFNEIHSKITASNTNKLGWVWGHIAKAAIDAYKYTGQERFLEISMKSYEIILKYRDSEIKRIDEIRGEILNGWSYKKNSGSKRKVTLVRNAMITLPVALFCEIALKDKNRKKGYKGIALKFLQTVEDAVSAHDDYYRITAKNEGYFIIPGDEKRTQALNQTHPMAATYAVLYSITGNEQYRVRVEQISRYFKSAITKLKNCSYVWGYDPQPYPENERKNCMPETVRKAGITILLPIIAYERGIFFTDEDMIAISKTFLDNIYLGGNQFNRFICWPEFYKPEKRKSLHLRSITKFIYFEKWDPEIRQIIEEAVESRKDIFPEGWLSSIVCLSDYAYSMQYLVNINKR